MRCPGVGVRGQCATPQPIPHGGCHRGGVTDRASTHPDADAGLYSHAGTYPGADADAGPYSRAGTYPGADAGPYSHAGTYPGADAGPYSHAGTYPGADAGPYSHAGTYPGADAGPYSRANAYPDADTAPPSRRGGECAVAATESPRGIPPATGVALGARWPDRG